MGVDHGLGGRDSLKSKLRREKKAKQLKAIAKSVRTEGLHNRNEVKFDEAARVAFVSGFHKRKQERRKYGLAMQIMKDKKERKDLQKEKEKILYGDTPKEPTRQRKGKNEDEEEQSEEEESENDETHHSVTEESNVLQQNTFEDDATLSMFGSAVSVVVSDDIKDKNEEFFQSNNSDEEGENEGSEQKDDHDNRSVSSRISHSSYKSSSSYHNKKNKQNQLTPFDRAMKKAKQMMGNKKKKTHIDKSKHVSSKFKKQVKSSKLLTKAFNTQNMKIKR